MKKAATIMIVVLCAVLLSSTTFADGSRWHGRWVEVNFEHDTSADIPWSPEYPVPLEEFSALATVIKNAAEVWGDFSAINYLISDTGIVFTDDLQIWIVAVVTMVGEFPDGEKINMIGTMQLEIDASTYPSVMKGYQRYLRGRGTHYGVLKVEGTAECEEGMPPDCVMIGTGTYKGVVHRNR